MKSQRVHTSMVILSVSCAALSETEFDPPVSLVSMRQTQMDAGFYESILDHCNENQL